MSDSDFSNDDMKDDPSLKYAWTDFAVIVVCGLVFVGLVYTIATPV